MNLWFICLLFFIPGCHKKQTGQTLAPTGDDKYDFAEAENRLVKGFLDHDFVVSRGTDGMPKGLGDSLIFTGLALYAMDCAKGEPLAKALEKMLTDQNGGVYRHPSIPGQTPSLDGLLGLYRGIAKRVTICDERSRWADVMENHGAYVKHNSLIPLGFDFVLNMLLAALDIRGEPSHDPYLPFELELANWVKAVKETKSACYRANLALLSLQTLEMLGDFKYGNFCSASKDMGLATVDQFCGRPGLIDYLSGFKENEWQYKHQRCPAWETPDGNGNAQPSVDYLVGWADLFGTPK